MKILAEQMSSLAVMMKEDFVASAAIHVDTVYPELTYRRSPDQITAAIRGFIEEAARFGLTSERTVIRYIGYRIEFRSGLLEAPRWAWARDILSSPALGEDEKIARIEAVAYGATPGEEA
jgi:hypothetical protein